jgi:5'-3' exonuclease
VTTPENNFALSFSDTHSFFLFHQLFTYICLYIIFTHITADLIHLGLALHEPRVLILRDRVEFFQKKNNIHKKKGPQDKNGVKGMDFLNIERLRQYLFYDFCKAFQTEEMIYLQQVNPSFTFNIEKIIDDFIFICFFVGNDFLPHLPSLSIRDGSLDLLLEIYRILLPQLNGYINNEGVIDLARAELLVSKFSLLETDILQKKYREEATQAKRDKYKAHAEAAKHNMSHATQATGGGAGAGAGTTTGSSTTGEVNASEISVELKMQLEKLVLDKAEKLVSEAAKNDKPLIWTDQTTSTNIISRRYWTMNHLSLLPHQPAATAAAAVVVVVVVVHLAVMRLLFSE